MSIDSSIPSAIVIGNSVRDSPIDALVPRYLEDTSDLVQHYFDQNESFARTAFADAQAAIQSLQAAGFPGALPDPPTLGTAAVANLAGTGLNYDSTPAIPALNPSTPAVFTPDDITVEDIADTIPEYVPVIAGISIPDAPTASVVTIPDAPTIDTEFDEPTAPTPDYGSAPVLTDFELPVYVPPVLPLFGETVPTFTTTPPEPVIQWSEPVYSSDIQDQVKVVLGEMLDGGTGLPADVELAIWERGREREDERVEQDIAAAIAQWASRNFSHPPGQLNSQIIVLRDKAARSVNDLSRDVMTKQADLEQKNRQFAVERALDYERVFTAIFLAVVERNFQIAKFGVETQIQIYNMQVTAFNVAQQIFAQQVLLYRTQIEAAFADIKAFEAQVKAVEAGAALNESLVKAYGERIRAFVAQVEAYNSLIKGQVAKSDLQKNKVDIYKVQVDGAVAQISAQREIFLAYNSKIQGETAKVQLEEANARTYTARVQAIGEQANIIVKQTDARIAKDRLRLDWSVADMQRMTALNGQQVALAQVQLAQYEAINHKAIARYDADLKGKQAQLQHEIDVARLQVARYEAMTAQWRGRVTEIIQMAEIQAQSMRAAGTIAGNLAAGAMAATHVSAGVSAQGQASQTSSRQVSDHTGHSESYSSGYNVNHNYEHKT